MDSPKAMQNSSTGMLATSVPVAVVPSPPRCPSWKIHTSAPNAAVNDNTFSANAVTGSTTLPASMNSSTKVMAAITASTIGSRWTITCTLSWLIWATPASRTGLPAGPATACSRSSWVWEADENSGAVLDTVRNALSSLTAVAALGGPAGAPSTNVATGEATDDVSGTCDNCAA